jgi:hypothetical protein
MPEGADGDPRVEIEVAVPGGVPQVDSFAAHHHERRLAIVRIKVLLCAFEQYGWGDHGKRKNY